jgi:two-component system cell cycle response regulator/two-component system cell cycle response regulator DivK
MSSTVGATVAIVEDDENTRDVFRTILEHNGMRVVEAVDGEHALDLIRSEHPDVVLLDLGLPGIDGRTVARELKADPATARVPIIVVTAAAEEDTRRWALRLGCSDFLEKPVELKTLTEAVVRCLEKAA